MRSFGAVPKDASFESVAVSRGTIDTLTVRSLNAQSQTTSNAVFSSLGIQEGGFIDMGGNIIHNVGEPVEPSDVATKEYADTHSIVYIAGNGLSQSGTTPVIFSISDGYSAKQLATTGLPVDVSGSSPPISGQALIAISTTEAEWKYIDNFLINSNRIKINENTTGPDTTDDMGVLFKYFTSGDPKYRGLAYDSSDNTFKLWEDIQETDSSVFLFPSNSGSNLQLQSLIVEPTSVTKTICFGDDTTSINGDSSSMRFYQNGIQRLSLGFPTNTSTLPLTLPGVIGTLAEALRFGSNKTGINGNDDYMQLIVNNSERLVLHSDTVTSTVPLTVPDSLPTTTAGSLRIGDGGGTGINGNILYMQFVINNNIIVTMSDGAVRIFNFSLVVPQSDSTTSGTLRFGPGGPGFNGNDTTLRVLVSSGVRMSITSARTTITNLLNTASSPPANAASSGTTGDLTWDSDFIYVCTNTNTWKRAAIATW